MHRTIRSTARLIPLAALGLAMTGPAAAQALPAAKTLLDRHVAATGGSHRRSLETLRTAGTFSMPAMGASGELLMIQARPNLMSMTVTIPGLGEIRTGFDGTTAWSLNPMEGPRVLSGGELVQLKDDAAFDSSLRDPSLVASMETVEKTAAGGRDCYKVRVTWKSGRETFDCFDVDNGLLVASWQTAETAMGPIETTVLYADYTKFGALTMPARTTQQVMGQEMVIMLTSVDFEAADASIFAPPPEIRALISK